MRIVYLNPSGHIGGAEAALLDVIASLGKAEPEWKLELVVSDDGPLAAKAKALGVLITVLPFPTSLAQIGDAATGGLAGRSAGGRLLRRAALRVKSPTPRLKEQSK